MKIFRYLLPSLFLLLSCGASDTYTTPFVLLSDIIQSDECRESGGEEELSYKVDGDEITFFHINISLPQNSVVGISDRYGNVSFDTFETRLLLDADEEYINLVESFSISNSSKICYYDLEVTLSNVSGGDYLFSIFSENKLIKQWEEIEVD